MSRAYTGSGDDLKMQYMHRNFRCDAGLSVVLLLRLPGASPSVSSQKTCRSRAPYFAIAGLIEE
jgi:hypothetical protein